MNLEELFAALQSTKGVHEQRTALAYIAIFFFITTVLF